MTDRKRLAFISRCALLHPTSLDTLSARSGFTSFKGNSRERPTASVSSVNGVGANTPVPAETRSVHCCGNRYSADTRGLKKPPYTLWASNLPLLDKIRRELTA